MLDMMTETVTRSSNTLPTQRESEQKTARLQEIRRYATRYEIVIELAGVCYLLGYLLGLSRGDLMNLAVTAAGDGPTLARLAGITLNDSSTYSRKAGWNFGNGKLRIYRSGRTEREAIVCGELSRFKA